MRKVAKLSITLPHGLLQEVQEQIGDEETRSEAIARLLKFALRKKREERDVERYIQGYLEQPETEEEMRINHLWAMETLKSEPWE